MISSSRRPFLHQANERHQVSQGIPANSNEVLVKSSHRSRMGEMHENQSSGTKEAKTQND